MFKNTDEKCLKETHEKSLKSDKKCLKIDEKCLKY